MSLEGTLETIALPDVLALLSVTAKTGELRIESRGGVGSVWFDAGRLAGFDVGTHTTAVDSLFGLLRLDEGHFKFYTGTSPVHAVEPQDVAPVLDEAETRLVQWAGIVAAVPSMYSQLSLQASAEGTVTLTATPAPGYVFYTWENGSAGCGGSGTCTFTMAGARSATALFIAARSTFRKPMSW